MRITLLHPPSALLMDDKVMAPLGILYLAAWLRIHGHEPQVIDLAGVDDWRAELKREIKKIDGAGWLGFSCTTPQYRDAQRIRDYIWHDLGFDGLPMVAGNIHITSEVYANRMGFLEEDGFTSYCTGEGFNAVTKMCDDLKNNGGLKRLYAEPIIPDVNRLPFAARDLIDIRSYRYKLGDRPCCTVYTQWGCYYQCSFCESRMNGSDVVRMMTPDRIAAEAHQIRDTFGFTAFHHFDDELNLSRDRLLGICQKYKEMGDVRWRGFLIAAKTDEEVFKAMKESGCYECAFGAESFSPTILRNIKKPASVDMNMRFIRLAKKSGLRVKMFTIVGLPGESWKTISETYRALLQLRAEGCAPDDIDVSICQVYHGSGIFQQKMADPKSVDIEFDEYDYEKMYYKSSPSSMADLIQVRTSGMTKQDLIDARNLLEKEFKPTNWIEDNTGRKDLDRIYESIRRAESKLART